MDISNSIIENLQLINEKIKNAYDSVPNNPNVMIFFVIKNFNFLDFFSLILNRNIQHYWLQVKSNQKS